MLNSKLSLRSIAALDSDFPLFVCFLGCFSNRRRSPYIKFERVRVEFKPISVLIRSVVVSQNLKSGM
jgi:hypothetical protein